MVKSTLRFVAYYHAFTRKLGSSGLSLEVRQAAVLATEVTARPNWVGDGGRHHDIGLTRVQRKPDSLCVAPGLTKARSSRSELRKDCRPLSPERPRECAEQKYNCENYRPNNPVPQCYAPSLKAAASTTL